MKNCPLHVPTALRFPKSFKSTEKITVSGLKANIVKLVDVSQDKGAGGNNCMIWLDNYFTVKAADNTDGCLEVICCS